MLEIDDETVAYIVEHRKHFEDLRTGLRVTELALADGESSRVR